MRARLVTPIVAAASFALLGCDRVSTAPERPGPPSFITNGTVDGSAHPAVVLLVIDRKSTRLNSSHGYISYAVFCLKKKKKKTKSVDDVAERPHTGHEWLMD